MTEARLSSLYESERFGGEKTMRSKVIRELIDEIRVLRRELALAEGREPVAVPKSDGKSAEFAHTAPASRRSPPFPFAIGWHEPRVGARDERGTSPQKVHTRTQKSAFLRAAERNKMAIYLHLCDVSAGQQVGIAHS